VAQYWICHSTIGVNEDCHATDACLVLPKAGGRTKILGLWSSSNHSWQQMLRCRKMKIAIMTILFTKRNMYVDACHCLNFWSVDLLSFFEISWVK
jgi:hypothetical protein